MTVRDLSSWAEFDDEAKRLLAAWQGKPGTSSLLFRGQCDSRWQLKTTLERFAPESLKASTYYWTIYGAKYQIESLTARSWDIPTPPEYDEWLSKQDSFSLFGMPEESYPYYDPSAAPWISIAVIRLVAITLRCGNFRIQ